MALQLFHGDCLEVMATLPDKSVDCFICDLPYGCLASVGKAAATKKRFIDGKDTGTTVCVEQFSSCAWDVPLDLERLWAQIKRLARNDHVPVLMFCTTKFGYDLIKSNESWFRYDLVWDKQRGVSFLSANRMPLRSHEMVYVFSKKGAAYKRVDVSGGEPYTKIERGIKAGNFIGWSGENTPITNTGTRCVKSVIPIAKGASYQLKDTHPTEKPVTLYRWLLERYCPAGGTVLDPTFGSGNSGRAARDLGLKYIGIEMDPGFFKKAHDDLLPADETTIEHV